MLLGRVRFLVWACVLAAATPSIAAPLLSRTTSRRSSLAGVEHVQKLALDRAALADLRARDRALIQGFPLGRERSADLVVARFDPFASGARVEVMEAAGPRELALPDQVYFSGSVAGEESSHVLLVAQRDRVHGFVVSRGEVYPFGHDPAGGHRSYALRDVDPTVHRPPGDFCGNDLYPEEVNVPHELAPEMLAADTTGGLKIANVALDTDQELRAKFSSDQATLDYLASLAAAATTIYERDVAVRLRFSYIRIWGAGTIDPWSATTPSGSLTEVRSYWNNAANNMAAIAGPRTVVHFLSGKGVQGGIAYLDVLCNANAGYGVSQVFGSFDLSRPSLIWDVVVFSHELGHNFGSSHTHCYSPPVDECYNQESGCYSGPVVASRGTVMSYCHLLAGGLSNIDLVFGGVVSARIGQSVARASCLATATPTTTTTSTTLAGPTSTSTTSPRASTTTSTTSSTTTTLAPRSAGDADHDGVLDGVDRCPDTPAGDLVDVYGCSVCPCDGPGAIPWPSRAAYYRCVRDEVRLRGRTARAALVAATKSSCARRRSTRCCVYARPDDRSGKCRILRAAACAAGQGTADLGNGSCVPSPCAR